MRLEGARGSKFAEFVPNHVFGDINGDEYLAVMDAEVDSDKIGGDGGSARPCLDGFAVACLLCGDHFVHQ